MSEITGGELLVRCLANEGVNFVFGLPCPEVDPILAALDGNGIRFVPVRHEAAAVHMAEGLYKTTGQVAAVLGNPGPGSANLLPGVITARHEGVPVLVITSQHRLGIVYPSTPSTFQGQDQLDVFRPAVKWSGPIFAWTAFPKSCAWPSARCGPDARVRCTSRFPCPCSTRPATRDRADPARYAARASLPQPSEAQLAGGRRPARARGAAARHRRHRRRPRRGQRRAARARRAARLSGHPVRWPAVPRCRTIIRSTSTASERGADACGARRT